MRREGTLSDLTDGKLYRSSDMARLGCGDCEGCSACCRGMGNSVVLDPYDVWRLERGLKKKFAEMIGKEMMLSVVDGLILPSLNMDATGTCPFLNVEGRCAIHAFRPGICRLFPLGRYYNEGGFSYVLMTGECKKENRTKVKIEKWLGEADIVRYENYCLAWKKLTEAARREFAEKQEQPEEQRKLCFAFLQKYYMELPQTDRFLECFLENQ